MDSIRASHSSCLEYCKSKQPNICFLKTLSNSPDSLVPPNFKSTYIFFVLTIFVIIKQNLLYYMC